MNIDFNAQRWDAVKRNYGQWWAGELDGTSFILAEGSMGGCARCVSFGWMSMVMARRRSG